MDIRQHQIEWTVELLLVDWCRWAWMQGFNARGA
jgi:hypothetical protein